MSYEIHDLPHEDWPPLLKQIPDPPQKLRFAGTMTPNGNKLLAVVGSREMTPYGKEAIETIMGWLKGAPVTIVSGLALGVDGTAHRGALRNNLHTISVPGSGLSQRVMYPSNNAKLAEEIVESAGGLLSEFEDDFRATPFSFPQRNRIMAGMSDATLIIEAKDKSGSLITARLALEYNRDVGIVPGNIFSPQSQGVNKLLRDGAHAIIEKQDIFELLKLKIDAISDNATQKTLFEKLSPEEKEIIDLLQSGAKETDEIITQSSLTPSMVLAIISSLSLKGLIKEQMGEISLNS